jgi:hypothetical protein
MVGGSTAQFDLGSSFGRITMARSQAALDGGEQRMIGKGFCSTVIARIASVVR